MTAYAQRPVQRIRPNGQFLQATLRNIESGTSSSAHTKCFAALTPGTVHQWKAVAAGNRRVEENKMWRQRGAQLNGKL